MNKIFSILLKTCLCFGFLVTASNAALRSVRSINCGGDKVGNFEADNSFTGGGTYAKWNFTEGNNAAMDSVPDSVFHTERYGDFTYKLTGLTASTPYMLRLIFSENSYDYTERYFNVVVNGKKELDNINPFTDAKWQMYFSVVKDVNTAADASGNLNIAFTTVPGSTNANIMGIRVFQNVGSDAVLTKDRTIHFRKNGNAPHLYGADGKRWIINPAEGCSFCFRLGAIE